MPTDDRRGFKNIAHALPRQGRALQRRSSRQGDGKAPETAAEAWRGDQVTSVDETGIGHVMRVMCISLRKALIVGASTTAVLLAAAPAWADVFVVDFTGPGKVISAEVFTGTTPPSPPAGDTVISVVDITTKPVLSGAPLGAPGPAPGAGLLSLAYFVLAGAKPTLREIAAFAHKTRARPIRASAVR